MNKLVPILLLAMVTPFCAQGQQTGGTLTGTLASQGLAGAKLERRYGNHLLVPVSINNRRGALMIDTGSPNTLIDRNSVNTFGLTVEKTDSSVGGLFGRVWERFGDEQSEKHRDGQLHGDKCSCGNRRFVRHESRAQQLPRPDRTSPIPKRWHI